MKRNFKITLICLALTALSSCKLPGSSSSSDDSGGSGGGATKSLFSTWTFTGQNWKINMSGFNESGTPVSGKWDMVDGSYCTCNFTLQSSAGSGDNTSGSFVTSGCSLASSGSDQAAAFCPSLSNNTGTYAHTGTTLDISLHSFSPHTYR